MLFRLVLFCFHARLFIDALWQPAGKKLTSWLSFVMSYCDVATFPLVSLEVKWQISCIPKTPIQASIVYQSLCRPSV